MAEENSIDADLRDPEEISDLAMHCLLQSCSFKHNPDMAISFLGLQLARQRIMDMLD